MDKTFISYSRKDMDFVRKLAGDLESAGYDVWWDITDLEGGDDWVKTIPQAISSSQYFIVVLTPNSVESEWVRKEYTQALSLRKKIIPILLVPCEMPFALNTINFVNFAVGEYPENFKKLLTPLGYTGENLVVAPYKKPFLASLPPVVLKFGIPGFIALILLGVFTLLPPKDQTQETPTVPPSPIIAASPTATATSEPPTVTDTPTPTASLTPTITMTKPNVVTPPTNTPPPPFSLPVCIFASDDVNVREGPSIAYDDLGQLKPTGSDCPYFSARIETQNEVWFQIAFDQKEKAEDFQDFGGGWIRGDALATLSLHWLTRPICIYNPDDPESSVNVHVLPGMNEELQGSPLKADGTNCPFITSPRENADGIWYRFAAGDRQKEEFKDYAGGWIHANSLVLDTFKLQVITLTPTPTFTPSFTPTRTPTITPSLTATNTFTVTPTATATDIPTDTPTP